LVFQVFVWQVSIIFNDVISILSFWFSFFCLDQQF